MENVAFCLIIINLVILAGAIRAVVGHARHKKQKQLHEAGKGPEPRHYHWLKKMGKTSGKGKWNNRKVKRHCFAILIGIAIMLGASTMAVSHQELMPHNVWDAIAYFLHGCGAIPIVHGIEPLWLLLMAAGE